jgi:hypothetical protein
MPLASVDSQILYLIGAAVYGVFVWFKSRLEKKQQGELEERVRREASLRPPAAPAGPGRPNALPPPVPASEDDRMRRFLEALGVPNTSGPAAPPPLPPALPPPLRPVSSPPPRRPQIRPVGPHLPVPPFVAQRPVVYPGPPPRQPAPRPSARSLSLPSRPLTPEELPYESRDPGRLDEPATAVEQISAEFDRLHTITVPAPTTALADGSAPIMQLSGQTMNAQTRLLRELLLSPQNLKTLLLAREVLGPPKSLSDF